MNLITIKVFYKKKMTNLRPKTNLATEMANREAEKALLRQNRRLEMLNKRRNENQQSTETNAFQSTNPGTGIFQPMNIETNAFQSTNPEFKNYETKLASNPEIKWYIRDRNSNIITNEGIMKYTEFITNFDYFKKNFIFGVPVYNFDNEFMYQYPDPDILSEKKFSRYTLHNCINFINKTS